MKRLFELMGCLLIALSCISFSSCGSDDDDNGGGDLDQRLVGTWYDNSHSSYVAGVRFNANSTCVYGEWSKGQSEKFNNKTEQASHWTTNGNKLNISYKYDDGDTDSDSYVYTISEDGKTLTLSGGEFDGTYTKK